MNFRGTWLFTILAPFSWGTPFAVHGQNTGEFSMNSLDCSEKDGRDWNAATEEERREFCALAAKSPVTCGVIFGNKIYRALETFYDTEKPCLLTTQIQTVLGLVISTAVQSDRVRTKSTSVAGVPRLSMAA